jgi:aspartyl-tRNA(Asn)/glutamyl-tRNA(Gln) amidotransferase subunit C
MSSSPLTHEEVDRIAALANLALTDRERDLFARQLADILGYADEISKVDTQGVARPLRADGAARG